MNNKLLLITLSLGLKIVLTLLVNDSLLMNPDEELNYQIAKNYCNGNGYSEYDIKTNSYVQTSFHGSFTVFIYEFLIKNDIKKESWVLIVYLISFIFFALSINYFYRLCLLFFKNEKYAYFSALTYCLYPSILFFVGTLFLYENLVLSLLIIVVFKLIEATKNGFSKSDYLVIPLIITFSCLIRSQTIAIYFAIFIVNIFFIVVKKKYSLIPLFLFSLLLASISYYPILLKNKNMFGSYIISTQTGFELLQGHNPTARGSWMGNWKESSSPIYKYAYSQIENLSALNEMEESNARKNLALRWIKENPMAEIKLSVRKLAIYFYPQNYEVLQGSAIINPINLLVHLFFMAYIIFIFYIKEVKWNEVFIVAPILATLGLSIIFFVGYRWRYYAEPFMIILAWKFVEKILFKFQKNIKNLN